MINIIEKKLEIDEGAKKRFEFIGDFTGYKPKYINGSIRDIDRTNISYIEPHRIIFKDITFLYFNYTNEVYVENLEKKIRINEIESYLNA
ncbi:MAG: hypothetical protein IKO49_05555 [Bacilli bacterium]|nr:hypothetical protein [Bacilli bacterium]